MKKILTLLLAVAMAATMLTGCAGQNANHGAVYGAQRSLFRF